MYGASATPRAIAMMSASMLGTMRLTAWHRNQTDAEIRLTYPILTCGELYVISASEVKRTRLVGRGLIDYFSDTDPN